MTRSTFDKKFLYSENRIREILMTNDKAYYTYLEILSKNMDRLLEGVEQQEDKSSLRFNVAFSIFKINSKSWLPDDIDADEYMQQMILDASKGEKHTSEEIYALIRGKKYKE